MAINVLKKVKSKAKDLVKKVTDAVKPKSEYVFTITDLTASLLTIPVQQQQQQEQQVLA